MKFDPSTRVVHIRVRPFVDGDPLSLSEACSFIDLMYDYAYPGQNKRMPLHRKIPLRLLTQNEERLIVLLQERFGDTSQRYTNHKWSFRPICVLCGNLSAVFVYGDDWISYRAEFLPIVCATKKE